MENLRRIARLDEHGQHQTAHGNDGDAGAGKGEDGEGHGGGDGEAARQPAEQRRVDAQQARAGAALHQQIARQRIERQRRQHLRDHQRIRVVGHFHGGLPDVPQQQQRHAAQGGEDGQPQHGAGHEDARCRSTRPPALPAWARSSKPAAPARTERRRADARSRSPRRGWRAAAISRNPSGHHQR